MDEAKKPEPMSRTPFRPGRGARATALASLALAGCVTAYQEPKDGPTSTIEFRNEAEVPGQVRTFQDPVECTGLMPAGTVDPKARRTIKVATGKRIAVSMALQYNHPLAGQGLIGGLIAAKTTRHCTPIVDFTPEPGRHYVFLIRAGGTCASDFYGQADEQRGTPNSMPTRFRERKWTMPATVAGASCTKP
jgi:hypothetical protein